MSGHRDLFEELGGPAPGGALFGSVGAAGGGRDDAVIPAPLWLPPRDESVAIPEPDDEQRRILQELEASGTHVVFGAPGTGKTLLLAQAMGAAARDRESAADLLLLAPSRRAAARLRSLLPQVMRDQVALPVVKTWSALAFEILNRAWAQGRLEGVPLPPRLLSGPEQDAVIADLLAGHRDGLPGPAWPPTLEEAVGTRGFRKEIREFFDRLTEKGLSPRSLAELAGRHGKPSWAAVSELYAEYVDVFSMRTPEAFDPAGLLRTCVNLFTADPEFLETEQRRLSLVAVDDAQDASRLVMEFLQWLAPSSVRLVLAANPDGAVQGFRGARPEVLAELPEACGRRAVPYHAHVLTKSHRLSSPMLEAWQRVVARIPAVGGARWRKMQADPVGAATARPDSEGIAVRVVPSPVHQGQYLGERILRLHLEGGIEFSDIAVIARTGGLVAEIERQLKAFDIPVEAPLAEIPLKDEAAVRPFLLALEAVLRPESLDEDRAHQLLLSPLGGATPVMVRRLRQALRRQELGAGGQRSSMELLLEALRHPGALLLLPEELTGPALRVGTVMRAAQQALAAPGPTSETVLWSMWQASGVAEEWKRRALAPGRDNRRHDRYLDSMVALFKAAERHSIRLPGAAVGSFVEYLMEQELPEDTLAPQAHQSSSVSVTTPANSVGRQWRHVFVAGVQDGVWPNLRVRGGLLGSAEFVDVVEGRAWGDHRIHQREILHDELRTFSTALSRGSDSVTVLAVDSEEERPSAFLATVDPEAGAAGGFVKVEPRSPLTIRSMVGELRRTVVDPSQHPDRRSEAARLLASLANRGVPGAHPRQWWGWNPVSTTEPLVPPGERVRVSPSKVAAVHRCPLCWLVDRVGGTVQTDQARNLGNLIHSLAETLPQGRLEELSEHLEGRWHEVGAEQGWQGELEHERARKMISFLSDYYRKMAAEQRELVDTEIGFTVEVGRAAVGGKVDRLERNPDGSLLVVDLKTGKSSVSSKDLPSHPQLLTYQLAVAEGAFGDRGADPGGAALVQLGSANKSLPVQRQDPLTDGPPPESPAPGAGEAPTVGQARELVETAASLMAGGEFLARHEHGSYGGAGGICAVPDVCPLCSGKQVTE